MIRQHPPPGLALDNPLWQQAGRYWQLPDFESACLAAQEDGWCVSHILVALFSAGEGLHWDGVEPEAIRQWRRGVTEPVRALRRSLHKEEPAVALLRQSLKSSELEAERLELAWWYRCIRENRAHWQPASAQTLDERIRHNFHQLFPDTGAGHSHRIATAIHTGAPSS